MDYDELRAAFEDVAFTTTTPFTDDGSAVDHGALAENLAALEAAGARLFVPCGNTGEYYALDDDERAAAVLTHVEAVGTGTVVGGVAGSTGRVLGLVEAYAAAGADGVMVMHPDHTHAHERGLVEYYRRIATRADEAGLGVVVYKRGHDLSRRVLAEVSRLDSVVAVKYAVDDVAAFAGAVAEVPGEVAWVDGLAERYAPAFALEGAVGYTTGVGNFAPAVSLALHEALSNGDRARARELCEAIRPFEELRDEPGADSTLPAANNVPAVKYGMDLAGLNGGPVREPLVDLPEGDRARAEERFERIRAIDV